MTKKLLTASTLLVLSITLSAQNPADTLNNKQAAKTYAVVTEIIEHHEPISFFPAANPLQQLQGRGSGFFVTSTSGRPGSPAAILIRGQNSIHGDSEPYYIVNGIPATAIQLSTLNVEDIESVTILKDAIATAQYGVNGGNGVIVIETKKGWKRPFQISVSAETGVSKILKNKFGLMNTQQKLDYERERGIIDQATYDKRLPYSYNQVNEIFRTAWLQQYNLQLSGGSDRTTYYLSGGYYTQDGILENSDYRRYTINANVNIEATRWLKTGVYLYLGKEKSTYPLTSEVGENHVSEYNNQVLAAIQLNPYEQLRNTDGSYNTNMLKYRRNPLYEASLFNDEQNNLNINGSVFFDIKFSQKFKLYSNLTLGQYLSEENIDNYSTNANSYSYYNHKEILMQQANRLSFTSYLDHNQNHHLEASLAQELKISDGSLFKFVQVPNFSNTLFPDFSFSRIRGSESKILSGTLKLDYSYKNRLYFRSIFRMDKLDLFSIPDKHTAKSWAVGLKWVILDSGNSAISRLALRGSTGQAGHLPRIATHIDLSIPLPSGGFHTPSIANPNPWETTQTHSLGLDAYFLGNRLSLTMEAYLKNTSDAYALVVKHLPHNLPSILFAEKGDVQNKGLEFDFNYYILANPKYFLSFSANLTLNKNKLKEFDNSYFINNVQVLENGKTLGGYYLARWVGVDPDTGYGLWYDSEGKTSQRPYFEEHIDGKSCIPSKYVGATISGGYKGFSLTAHLYGTWDIYTFNQNLYDVEINSTYYYSSPYNVTTRSANYWKEPGDKTEFPNRDSYTSLDDRLLQNHSYVRLKSLTLAYDFNRRFLRRALRVVDGCRIYVAAHNLFTITGYRGFTPEVMGYRDYGAYPEARTFSWGIRLTFK